MGGIRTERLLSLDVNDSLGQNSGCIVPVADSMMLRMTGRGMA